YLCAPAIIPRTAGITGSGKDILERGTDRATCSTDGDAIPDGTATAWHSITESGSLGMGNEWSILSIGIGAGYSDQHAHKFHGRFFLHCHALWICSRRINCAMESTDQLY